MASTAVRNANRNAVHAARPGSRPAIHVDAKPTPTAPVPEDTALLDGLTASVSAADAKKAAAAEKRAAAKLAKEAAEAAKAAEVTISKTDMKRAMATDLLIAIGEICAEKYPELAQEAANMCHHFPAGKNEDGSRIWPGMLPRPIRSDWK